MAICLIGRASGGKMGDYLALPSARREMFWHGLSVSSTSNVYLPLASIALLCFENSAYKYDRNAGSRFSHLCIKKCKGKKKVLYHWPTVRAVSWGHNMPLRQTLVEAFFYFLYLHTLNEHWRIRQKKTNSAEHAAVAFWLIHFSRTWPEFRSHYFTHCKIKNCWNEQIREQSRTDCTILLKPHTKPTMGKYAATICILDLACMYTISTACGSQRHSLALVSRATTQMPS